MSLDQKFVLERKDFQKLLDVLLEQGYGVLAPTVKDAAIVYDSIRSVDELPQGWTDEQNGGKYRLHRRNDQALFGYAVGPHSWKKFLHPPAQRLWTAKRDAGRLQVQAEQVEPAKLAFLGVRACELHAIAIQDKVFLGSRIVETGYQSRRENVFIVAVNCGTAAGTCFCASMNTGPKAVSGFDLALTEVLEDGRHYFVMEAGSDSGAQILRLLPHQPAQPSEQKSADQVCEKTAKSMGRHMDSSGIKELLDRNYNHPRWDDVAARCLTCANCTMVCPTCFCTTIEDVTDLKGENAERWQKWDSCFNLDFSYIHGGNIRATAKSRYRQWMTHKLSTWFDQFGSSGCVGCGRCITWCPVGIDITEEVAAIRQSQDAKE